jgi:4-hydroxythreonine-4-phosphate dehydrogenase
MAATQLPRIAIAIGDPAGIGPEISLKAARWAQANGICQPLLVGQSGVLLQHAARCGWQPELRALDTAADAVWCNDTFNVLSPAGGPNDITFGTIDAAYGRAAVEAARLAIHSALSGQVDAVVAAPQTERSIALAGIQFDGYPSLVARETGMDPHDVFLMICFDDVRVAHCTLHVSVREALTLITRDRVKRVIVATEAALKRLGFSAPRICVSGLNPHAGEDGLFGREEIETISPAIADAAKEGIAVIGPVGADIMFRKSDVDGFVVMLHDQGHIPAKLKAFNRTAGLSIGSPILFSSVAHGSAFDIAGKGIADPGAMIEAIARLAGMAARNQ